MKSSATVAYAAAMLIGQPSRTALAAAAHRAAHQVLEGGRIFADPLAVRILGRDAARAIEDMQQPLRRAMRIFIAARTRFAEDALAAAVAHGVRQLVVLGAGLDTYAYRSVFGDRLHIFEVDHPATQGWKRERLAAAGISIPPSLTFAPVDFEHATLAAGLAAAGFDPTRRTFFTWLGVVPYLTQQSVFATLSFIGALPGGAHVVFDYGNPPDTLAQRAREVHDVRAAKVAALGEEWKSYFEAPALHERMRTLGFSEFEDLSPPQIATRFFPERTVVAPASGGHILLAATRP